MEKIKKTKKIRNVLNDLKAIAALFKCTFPNEEKKLIKDISSITQDNNEIIIYLTRKSYLREIINSWRLTSNIAGIYNTDREITIILAR